MKIDITLSNEQGKALEALSSSEYSRVLYGGQAGGGKSFLISLWQIVQRIKYPATRGYIGREVLKNLKNSILVTFFDVAKMLGLKNGYHYTYNDNKSYIDFANDSRIVLLDLFDKPSDPNWESLGSTEYTDGAIEEGSQISKRAADLLLSRTRYKHIEYNINKAQLITCNPADGWIKDKIVVPYYEGQDIGNTIFIPASLQSNPNKAFVDSYQKTLEELPEYDKARLLHGDWFAHPKTGGEFYKDFDSQKHVTYNNNYNEALPLHITFDFNVNPYMTCCVWQVEDKQAIQIDEICLQSPRNSTKAVCREFMKRYNNHYSGLFIYGDPSGKARDTRNEKDYNDYTIIQKHLESYKPKLRIASKAPSITMRGNFINSIFEKNIFDISLLIFKDCRNTINDYSYMLETAEGKKEKQRMRNETTKVSYEKYGHTSDANDYFICEYFKQEFNNYVYGGKKIDIKHGGRELVHIY